MVVEREEEDDDELRQEAEREHQKQSLAAQEPSHGASAHTTRQLGPSAASRPPTPPINPDAMAPEAAYLGLGIGYERIDCAARAPLQNRTAKRSDGARSLEWDKAPRLPDARVERNWSFDVVGRWLVDRRNM